VITVSSATNQKHTNETCSKPALSEHYTELATRSNCLLTELLGFFFKKITLQVTVHMLTGL